jgi:N-acetylglucosaminyldiphosphoundecaprenol N-acetyl-beta-D-mannosaminyltransferase
MATHMPVVELAGVRFDALTEQQAVAAILHAVEAGRGGWVLTPNLAILRAIARSAGVRSLVAGADLVLADGVPVLWASRLQGTPLPQTVPGSSLVFSLAAGAAQRGASIFLLGGNPGVAEVAARRLRDRCPGLAVAGTLSPPFGFEHDPAELRRIREALAAARPDIVFVGLGFPKQERLIAELRETLPRAWFLGVGIALSFAAGDLARAPVLLRRLGLEWLYRLAQEPRRLYRRYLVEGLPFALRLFAGVLARRVVRQTSSR